MCEPPAKIVATNVHTLRPGRAPPTRPTRRTDELTNVSNPSRNINVAGTISPALATNDGSSKVTATRSIRCDTWLTESASRGKGHGDVEHRHAPCSGGTFRGYAHAQRVTS